MQDLIPFLNVIDFWGAGYDIAERMGVLPRIPEQGYRVREVRLVDRAGEKVGGFSTDVFVRATGGRFTSIRRSDLAKTIFDDLDGRVETIFGDSVATIDDRGDCVNVTFERAASREVDLVIGADGLHSRVRGLVFGDDRSLEVPLGYRNVVTKLLRFGPVADWFIVRDLRDDIVLPPFE